MVSDNTNQTTAATITPGATPVAEADEIDGFGSEHLGAGRNGRGSSPERIESRFIGDFTGWRGATEFSLENGQVWKQNESGRLSHRATGPMITIRRGAFDTYRLSVEGINRSVRVRRIK